MLVDIKGDLLRSAATGGLVGIPVNTVGVAGKGLARYMKVVWPTEFERYVKDCKKGRIATGDLKVYENQRFKLAMMPTKYYWGNPSDIYLIKVTCVRLKKYMKDNSIDVAYLPRIGCGERTGGLDYLTEVRPVLEEVFGEEDELEVRVYDWG